MYLYFVRHGESVANREHVFSNEGQKHPLTPAGQQQAHKLAWRLASRPVARVYSSPLVRAVQTAEILAEHLRAPLQISDALREWSVGLLEGTGDEEGWRQHRQVQEDWFIHRRWDSRIPGGESFLDMRARFVPFIEAVTQQGQSTDEHVVLVGHGGLYLAMLPVVLSNVADDVMGRPFPHTGYVVAETRAGSLVCVEWCGTPVRE
jgi:2,3-bisphosphoglycerate-dependent phosphoglycerate mutase